MILKEAYTNLPFWCISIITLDIYSINNQIDYLFMSKMYYDRNLKQLGQIQQINRLFLLCITTFE